MKSEFAIVNWLLKATRIIEYVMLRWTVRNRKISDDMARIIVIPKGPERPTTATVAGR